MREAMARSALLSARRAEEIHALKVGMMGPVAAMGDSLFWATFRPFCGLLAAGLAFSGAFPPGKYTLNVEASGFADTTVNVEVVVAATLRVADGLWARLRFEPEHRIGLLDAHAPRPEASSARPFARTRMRVLLAPPRHAPIEIRLEQRRLLARQAERLVEPVEQAGGPVAAEGDQVAHRPRAALERRDRLIERATEQHLPLIIISGSGGGARN